MARIIPLTGDPHLEVQKLLPWYATGTLDALEHAQVEAHLAGCPDCRAELAFERRLRPQIAELPLDAQGGWERLQQQMTQPAPPPRAAARPPRPVGGWLVWAVAAQFLLILCIGALALAPRTARYQTLGAPPPPAVGDMVVMFRPETPERDLRRVLQASGARLVDGPTSADAYVLRAPAGRRDAALAELRKRREITLAEPLDGGARSP
jgi:anti-sigma factor RsiW